MFPIFSSHPIYIPDIQNDDSLKRMLLSDQPSWRSLGLMLHVILLLIFIFFTHLGTPDLCLENLFSLISISAPNWYDMWVWFLLHRFYKGLPKRSFGAVTVVEWVMNEQAKKKEYDEVTIVNINLK